MDQPSPEWCKFGPRDIHSNIKPTHSSHVIYWQGDFGNTLSGKTFDFSTTLFLLIKPSISQFVNNVKVYRFCIRVYILDGL